MSATATMVRTTVRIGARVYSSIIVASGCSVASSVVCRVVAAATHHTTATVGSAQLATLTTTTNTTALLALECHIVGYTSGAHRPTHGSDHSITTNTTTTITGANIDTASVHNGTAAVAGRSSLA